MNYKIEQLPINKLKINPNNPRLIRDANFKSLVKSLADCPSLFDARPCIVSDRTGDLIILAGNMRFLAAKKLEYKQVPVVIMSGLTELQEQEILLKDNGQTWGEWDWEILSSWGDLPLADWGLELPDEWGKADEPEGLTAPDAVPEVPEVPVTKPGDLWLLGEHRVLCGDSTKREDVERLMDGAKADLVFTDPPYNVSYGSSKNPIWGSKWNGKGKDGVIENDSMSTDDWAVFCEQISATLKLCAGPVYVCHAPGPDGMRLTLTFVKTGFHWSSTIILKKDRLVPGRADYQKIYEGMLYGWFEGSKIKHLEDRTQVDVWEYKRPSVNDLHPTMKPVEIMTRAIDNHPSCRTVFDPFLGSGSTLIAAEKTNRKCYGIEIDCHYTQVILERWMNFTGKQPTLESTGQTFDEVRNAADATTS